VAKTEWKRVVPLLQNLGIITKLDQSTLAAYCQSLAEYHAATRQLIAEGSLIEQTIYARDSGKAVGTRTVPHPAVSLPKSAYNVMRRFAAEFGLTPVSRKKIKLGQTVVENDPIAELINRANHRSGDFVPRRRRASELDQLDVGALCLDLGSGLCRQRRELIIA
jgi:P27 family predicted phage terminase small subunit